ncbi:hypothetical protein [Paenibacillus sp. PSB04]|uniref:hypothetical protein n=1 Tax=Paenibacillus sp. PSB04 TaxID=2866810 RepID=UPI0021F12050|nr:hypothetical protein [Paenibacillus sp. PSB04]UYO03500.1 hypothetical protein K2F33_28125 [Paenibacillus sp. PSB04]
MMDSSRKMAGSAAPNASLQKLIRHETLGIIKSETLAQLVSDSALIDLLKISAQMRKSVLEQLHDVFYGQSQAISSSFQAGDDHESPSGEPDRPKGAQ